MAGRYCMSDSPSARLLTPQATPALPFCPLHPTRHCTPASATASRPSKGLCSHRRLVPTFCGWLGRRWGLRHGTHVYHEHGIPTDARHCFHMAVARMALRWSGKRPTKRASLCDGSAWPVVPFGSGETAAHRLRGAAIPTQRWAICVTRRVKWAVALDLDSWTAEQRVVWAAAEEDAEGMPRGVGTGLRSRRGAKRRWHG